MQLQINSQVLADGIKKVEKVVNNKHNIPVLRGIFMECTNEEIILVGSDTHESIRFHIPVDGTNVDVIEPGKCVLTKQGWDLFKKIKTTVDMKLKDMNLIIYGKKSEFNLTVFDAEEYPKLPRFDLESPTLTLKGEEFQSMIRKTVFAASKSETRPILQGVNLILGNDCIQFVSTDAHRLGRVKYALEQKIKVDTGTQLVISAKALDKLTKAFDVHEDVSIYVSTNQIILKSGSLFFYSRLLEGKYPDTSRLIPTDFDSEMKIHRLEILDSLERISGLFESEQTAVVKLHVNGAASLSTNHTQVGKGQEVVEYEELTGDDDFTIAFSSKFMADALKSMDDEYVVFKFCGNTRPFIITPTTSTFDEVQLILPVRMV